MKRVKNVCKIFKNNAEKCKIKKNTYLNYMSIFEKLHFIDNKNSKS